MSITSGIVAFVNQANGSRIEGTYVADTGISWLIKPEGHPVQALLKTEWASVPVEYTPIEDIFRLIEGVDRG
jgi:phytoene dehydrogenase-like protein